MMKLKGTKLAFNGVKAAVVYLGVNVTVKLPVLVVSTVFTETIRSVVSIVTILL